MSKVKIKEEDVKILMKKYPSYTLDELSTILKISRSTLYRFIKSSNIKLNYICCCGKEFNNYQSLNSHSSHCITRRSKSGEQVKSNKERFGDRCGWSKGLTNETSSSVKKRSKAVSNSLKGKSIGRKHSLETKDKMSKARVSYLQNNDNHSNWYSFSNGEREIKVQGSWEKRFVEYLISNNIKWDRFAIKYENHRRYTPDFYLPDFNIYIEVKGWMKDRDIDKMKRFLIDNPTCDIRLVDNLKQFKELEERKISLTDLVRFIDKY